MELRKSPRFNDTVVPLTAIPRDISLIFRTVPGDTLPSLFLRDLQGRETARGSLQELAPLCSGFEVTGVRTTRALTIVVGISCSLFTGLGIFPVGADRPHLLEIPGLRDFALDELNQRIIATHVSSESQLMAASVIPVADEFSTRMGSDARIMEVPLPKAIRIIPDPPYMFLGVVSEAETSWSYLSTSDYSSPLPSLVPGIAPVIWRGTPAILLANELSSLSKEGASSFSLKCFEGGTHPISLPATFFPHQVGSGENFLVITGRDGCYPALFRCTGASLNCSKLMGSSFGDFFIPRQQYGKATIQVIHEDPIHGPLLHKVTSDSLTSIEKRNFQLPFALREVATKEGSPEIRIPILFDSSTDPSVLVVYSYGSYGMRNEPLLTVARAALINSGIAFAFPMIRGGGECGEAWSFGGWGASKEHGVTDVSGSLRALAEDPVFRGKPLFLWSRSAGASTVLRAAHDASHIVKGLILEAPAIEESGGKAPSLPNLKSDPNVLPILKERVGHPLLVWFGGRDTTVDNGAAFRWLQSAVPQHRVFFDPEGSHKGPSSSVMEDRFYSEALEFINSPSLTKDDEGER